MHEARNVADALSRRRAAALAGHLGDVQGAQRALTDPDDAVRATALSALDRLGRVQIAELAAAMADASDRTRRAACEVAGRITPVPAALVKLLLERLEDDDAAVAEVAAWAIGEVATTSELPDDSTAAVVTALSAAARQHEDALVRESAIAALGAIGDPRGLPAILGGTADKPAVRRRAVLALAPFNGLDVDDALSRATKDRDWQVREAAELLLREEPEG